MSDDLLAARKRFMAAAVDALGGAPRAARIVEAVYQMGVVEGSLAMALPPAPVLAPLSEDPIAAAISTNFLRQR